MRRPRRSPARLVLTLVVGALALLGVGAAVNGTLVYDQTPGQLRAAGEHPAGEQVRVTGTVVPGTLAERQGTARFWLEGGGARLEVHAVSLPSGTFKEGRAAVVEGALGADGVLTATQVIAKHGNTYQAPDSAGSAGKVP